MTLQPATLEVSDDAELDALFRDAMVARAQGHEHTNSAWIINEMRDFFKNPRHWFPTHGVELIFNGESQGVFQEYLHPTGARRLVRASAGVIPSTTEFI